MILKFKKGKHRARPLYWLRWWPLLIAPKKIERSVVFSFDSVYELPGGDQEDVNKLFGVAFGGVHKESARFGWQYSAETKSFILSSYVYVNGERIVNGLCHCEMNNLYKCSIVILKDRYKFYVSFKGNIIGSDTIFKFIDRKFGWLLGSYFGGNQSAPANLSLRLSKI